MSFHRYCDGLRRRDFLKVGALGAAGLTLADYLRLDAAEQVNRKAKGKSAIFIYLGGGPTHLDTFDPKPEAPAEIRGELKTIATKTAGMQICELLPNLAKTSNLYTVLRGVSHSLAAHEFGTQYMTTGNRPIPSLEYPGYGAVASKELRGDPELPSFVAIPNTPERAGFLGIANASFATTGIPQAGKPFSVRGLSLAGGVTMPEVQRRQKLLSQLDTAFNNYETKSDLLGGLDRFSDQAFEILSSKKSREAFDISKESPALVKQFGQDGFGQSCLLATRLIESGVRFVTISHGGWDTHANNTDAMKKKLPIVDVGLSSLFTTLAEKGLLDSTAVFMTGEFGRTPKINPRGGRDHYPRAMFCVMGGGGVKGGQVVGASDKNGMGPADKPITPEMVGASFYHALGINYRKEYQTTSGRPIMIVREGEHIPRLFS